MKSKKEKTKKDFKKMFPITSICKEDIVRAFAELDIFEKVKKRVENMDDAEMRKLAEKMADDYLEQLFWDSLRTIFEDRFLEE
jgi:hypothetical protein